MYTILGSINSRNFRYVDIHVPLQSHTCINEGCVWDNVQISWNGVTKFFYNGYFEI